MQSKASTVVFVYEAGPCGYGIHRQLTAKGYHCMVCAPSLIPRKPGERVKTDRRDAAKLVRSLRAGDLSPVHVPTVEDEAFRDLVRTWGAARQDLKQARQRLKAFLLGHDVRYTGRADSGPAHRRWISGYTFDEPPRLCRRPPSLGLRRTSGAHQIPIVDFLCFRRRYVPERAEQPMVVIPVNPFERGELDVLERTP